MVQAILDRKYDDRWTTDAATQQNYGVYSSRSILSPKRSLGSVIKLLTPSEDYTESYNNWLRTLPSHIHALVLAIKRFYNPAWGDDWRRHFSVDFVNGSPGHELKLHDRKIVGTYLRVGLSGNHGWRTFKVRQDFAAADRMTRSIVALISKQKRISPGVIRISFPTSSRSLVATSMR